MLKNIKHSKFINNDQCTYCGKTESASLTSPKGWFGCDSDGDKICDACADNRSDQDMIEGEFCDQCSICHCNPASVLARRRHSINPPSKEFMRMIARKPRQRKKK